MLNNIIYLLIALGLIGVAYKRFPWENVTFTISTLLALVSAFVVVAFIFDKEKEHLKKESEGVSKVAICLFPIFTAISIYLWVSFL